MKNPFKTGAKKTFSRLVEPHMIAEFDAGKVHEVYGTFWLGRDAEWVCRLFVLEMLEEGEEGIGTYLSVNHLGPAVVGDTVLFEAQLMGVEDREIRCRYSASVGARLIAKGETGQKIIRKARFDSYLATLRK